MPTASDVLHCYMPMPDPPLNLKFAPSSSLPCSSSRSVNGPFEFVSIPSKNADGLAKEMAKPLDAIIFFASLTDVFREVEAGQTFLHQTFEIYKNFFLPVAKSESICPILILSKKYAFRSSPTVPIPGWTVGRFNSTPSSAFVSFLTSQGRVQRATRSGRFDPRRFPRLRGRRWGRR